MYVIFEYYNNKVKIMKININKKIISTVVLFVLPVVMFYTMEWFLRNPFEKMRFSAQFLNIVFFELTAVSLPQLQQ